jgi:hypothetical protein
MRRWKHLLGSAPRRFRDARTRRRRTSSPARLAGHRRESLAPAFSRARGFTSRIHRTSIRHMSTSGSMARNALSTPARSATPRRRRGGMDSRRSGYTTRSTSPRFPRRRRARGSSGSRARQQA